MSSGPGHALTRLPVHPTFQCSEACGGGEQQRLVTCPEPGLCEEALRPNSTRPCNTHPCTQWVVGPWGQVSQPAGQGRARQAPLSPACPQGVVLCCALGSLVTAGVGGGQMRSPRCRSSSLLGRTGRKETGGCWDVRKGLVCVCVLGGAGVRPVGLWLEAKAQGDRKCDVLGQEGGT